MEKPIKPIKPRIPDQPTKENTAYLYENVLEIRRSYGCYDEPLSESQQSDFSVRADEDDSNLANFYLGKTQSLDIKLKDLVVDCNFKDYNLFLLFKRKIPFEKRNELYQKDLSEYNLLSAVYEQNLVVYENNLKLYKESSLKEKKEKKIKSLEKQLNDLKNK